MKGEIIKFSSSDRIDLEGILCLPKKRTRTAVIYLHGMTGHFWDHPAFNLCDAITKSGVAFFSFNNRGSSMMRKLIKRRGKKIKRLVGGTSFEHFEDCVNDIEGAIRCLRKRGFRSFVLCGHSTGCQKIAYYQSTKKNPAVKGLILLAPADDMNLQKTHLKKKFSKAVGMAKRMFSSGKKFSLMLKYSNFSAYRYYRLFKEDSTEGNLFNYSKQISVLKKIKVPVLAVFGKKEHRTTLGPEQMLEKLREAKPDISTSLIPGDHSYRGGEKQLRSVVVKWLKSNFR